MFRSSDAVSVGSDPEQGLTLGYHRDRRAEHRALCPRRAVVRIAEHSFEIRTSTRRRVPAWILFPGWKGVHASGQAGHTRAGAILGALACPCAIARIPSTSDPHDRSTVPMETLQWFIEHYGYVAVFVGCLLEGETILVLAGFAAHMGYLSLPTAIATAAVAGFLGDQMLFTIGRRWGDRVFERFPRLASVRPRAKAFLRRHGSWAAFAVRFMVGMRLVGAIAIGATGFPRVRFMLANAVGACFWALVIGSAGYAFGQAFTLFLARARHLELAAFAVIAVAGIVAVVVMRRRARRPGLAQR